jgi:hypothetical protein
MPHERWSKESKNLLMSDLYRPCSLNLIPDIDMVWINSRHSWISLQLALCLALYGLSGEALASSLVDGMFSGFKDCGTLSTATEVQGSVTESYPDIMIGPTIGIAPLSFSLLSGLSWIDVSPHGGMRVAMSLVTLYSSDSSRFTVNAGIYHPIWRNHSERRDTKRKELGLTWTRRSGVDFNLGYALSGPRGVDSIFGGISVQIRDFYP